MSKENQEFSGIFREINREFRAFTTNYTTAVKNGADKIKQDIMKVLENQNQPIDVVAGKLFEAIKLGVQYAVDEMLDSGSDIVEKIKEKWRKK